MRHKLFIEKSDALQFAEEVQQAVDANIDEARQVLMVTGNIKIMPAFVEWMGKYSVLLVIEPEGMDEMDVVNDINQPVVEMEGM